MKELSRGGRVASIVAAAVAVVVVAGSGGAVAGSMVTSAKIKNNTIQGVDVKNGSLTGSDIRDHSLTNSDVSVYFATVDIDGHVVDQSGGIHAAKSGTTGNYKVIFPVKVDRCAFSATVGSTTEGAAVGQVNVADLSENPYGVFVATLDPPGATGQYNPFHLIVVC